MDKPAPLKIGLASQGGVEWGGNAHIKHLDGMIDFYVDALRKIQWQKDCGIDSIDPKTKQMINHADAERDAMYRIATEAVGPSKDELLRRERSQSGAEVNPTGSTNSGTTEHAQDCKRAHYGDCTCGFQSDASVKP
jgi:hypothetical protein